LYQLRERKKFHQQNKEYCVIEKYWFILTIPLWNFGVLINGDTVKKIIISMTKLLDGDRLRGVQLFHSLYCSKINDFPKTNKMAERYFKHKHWNCPWGTIWKYEQKQQILL
jgi:hypothetical protein